MSAGLAKKVSGNNDALKQHLLDSVKQQKANFMTIAKEFYQKGHRSREEYIQLTDAIIQAVDNVLNENSWDDSLFLRNTLKPLKEIREEAIRLKQEATMTVEEHKMSLRGLTEDEMFAYISIFQSDGQNLRKWELQLNSIRSHLLGRPVYENEDDVQKVMRQKVIQTSEAYIVVAIKKEDVQNFAYQASRVDRLGNPLLTLKESAVKPENIFEFIHQGKRFFFKNGKLIPQE